MLERVKDTILKKEIWLSNKVKCLKERVCNLMCNVKTENGEVYVDTGVKILIAVIIGAVLLVALIALFKVTIMPTVESKVTEMFNKTPPITP